MSFDDPRLTPEAGVIADMEYGFRTRTSVSIDAITGRDLVGLCSHYIHPSLRLSEFRMLYSRRMENIGVEYSV